MALSEPLLSGMVAVTTAEGKLKKMENHALAFHVSTQKCHAPLWFTLFWPDRVTWPKSGYKGQENVILPWAWKKNWKSRVSDIRVE